MKLCFSFPFKFILLVFLLQSCVTAKITSVKDINYTKKPARIFILVNNSNDTKTFWNESATEMVKGLKGKGVEAVSYVKSNLSLDSEGDINKKINDYNPEAVLIIRQTVTSGSWRGGQYELTLTVPEEMDKKNVWKCQFEPRNEGAPDIHSAARENAQVILGKLSKDKIL